MLRSIKYVTSEMMLVCSTARVKWLALISYVCVCVCACAYVCACVCIFVFIFVFTFIISVEYRDEWEGVKDEGGCEG